MNRENDHDLLIQVNVKLKTLIDDVNTIKKRIIWIERLLYSATGLTAATGLGVGVAKAFMI